MAFSQRFASPRRRSRLDLGERERDMAPSFRELPDVRCAGRKKVCDDYGRTEWVGAGSLAADRWRPKARCLHLTASMAGCQCVIVTESPTGTSGPEGRFQAAEFNLVAFDGVGGPAAAALWA